MSCLYQFSPVGSALREDLFDQPGRFLEEESRQAGVAGLWASYSGHELQVHPAVSVGTEILWAQIGIAGKVFAINIYAHIVYNCTIWKNDCLMSEDYRESSERML